MSGDTLRRAAALMRERAEATGWVTLHRPWGSDGEQVTGGDGQWMLVATATDAFDDDDDSAVATHIASWHPAVTLAVADWLEYVADHGCGNGTTDADPALAAARAYLGEEASP